jgi:cytochrome c peroxidase
MLFFLTLALVIPLGLDLYLPIPDDNPLTDEKIALGRQLFSDPRLSRDGTIACTSCHDPARAFSDGRPVAIGVLGRRGRRNAPALINRGYGRAFFWDARVSTLETQVLKPIEDPNEMDLLSRQGQLHCWRRHVQDAADAPRHCAQCAVHARRQHADA